MKKENIKLTKVTFVCDENLCAAKLVSKNAFLVDFANYLWEKYNNDYRKLKTNFFACREKDFNLAILEEVKQTENHKKKFKAAQINLKRIEKNF